ncbi:ABC transporter ATP-binding protein [Paenibacillus sp. ACRRX]|uniref:ABC transporter ATP-binding protein n=1 Tax=unclassified Paenibacillus TaxID=185978 RepID=UPI001EF65A69|nr:MULTISPECIES: ABC transporter ATP-binding protein [unclassified Paenibacillus]MCG7410021.1 ABC transporter ATP-binding protein [Paenibacillus sp. ACRRX]MDK8182914.1 ABC transporter ATP-binding protein [Paenibacillus sp. UMB4589-SE434]
MLKVNKLVKTYEGKVATPVLKGINLAVRQGEFVGVMGPSGSGKTTLLNMVATIDSPSSGEVMINGMNPHTLKKDKLASFRRRELGFVFQSFNLLNTLTVEENIVLPLTLEGVSVRKMKSDARLLADRLGITPILDKRSYEISGGQMQRTAIARAIIHRPKLLLADEPTGNLDSKSSKDVMETLENINKSDGTTMMMVTHDAFAASYCDRVIFIKDGELYHEIFNSGNRQVFFQQIMDALSMMSADSSEFSTVRV